MIQEIQIAHQTKNFISGDSQNQKTFKIIPFEKDQTDIHLLAQFISIIKHQLPNMNQNDLFRTIFSASSENCLLCDQSNIIGGVCFQKINQYKGVQIIFCVVSEKHQRKGNGSLMMNNLKNYLIRRSINVIGVHADNNAVRFYEKHSFSNIQYIPNRYFQRSISYQNSTLMQTKLKSVINYLRLSKCLQNQKLFIQNYLNQQAISYNYKKQHYLWSNNKSYLQIQRYINVNQNIKIVNPQYLYANQLKQKTSIFPQQKVLKHSLKTHIRRLQMILAPQLLKFDPRYKKIQILQYKVPICLQNIEQKVKRDYYINIRQFKHDLSELIENCLEFYKERPRVILNLYEVKDFLATIT